MSRCECCNVILTPQEATRKFKGSNTYTDMCNKCLSFISDDVETIEGNAPDEADDEYEDE